MVIGFLKTILLNDLGSEVIFLLEVDGELIFSCRLVNIMRGLLILRVGLRKASDS